MANTYTSLYYHLIFSTKNRVPWIRSELEPRLWEYLGGIARRHKMTALHVGGTADHIHAAILAPATLSPSQIAQALKGDSSKWIHGEIQNMCRFEWQDGYGAFTVGSYQLPELIRYIQNQREHHRVKTFQEEYVYLLEKHGIKYEERYLWG